MYHVTSRGVRKADVFTDARDRLRFQQIFQNVVDQTAILRQLMDEGYPVAREDLAALSPYLTSHIKLFGDYVIDLEINAVTLYEQGSANTLFRGHAEISIDVVDVHKPAEGPLSRRGST